MRPIPGEDAEPAVARGDGCHEIGLDRPIGKGIAFGEADFERLRDAVAQGGAIVAFTRGEGGVQRADGRKGIGLSCREEGRGQHEGQEPGAHQRCMKAFLASSWSSDSRWSGSSTQQSTGQTAAHWGSSWKPTHSVHLSVAM